VASSSDRPVPGDASDGFDWAFTMTSRCSGRGCTVLLPGFVGDGSLPCSGLFRTRRSVSVRSREPRNFGRALRPSGSFLTRERAAACWLYVTRRAIGVVWIERPTVNLVILGARRSSFDTIVVGRPSVRTIVTADEPQAVGPRVRPATGERLYRSRRTDILY